MNLSATAPQLAHAESWIKARGVTLSKQEPNATHLLPFWVFNELPDTMSILLDQLYGAGDEATFDSRDAAVNALTLTLSECAELARIGVP